MLYMENTPWLLWQNLLRQPAGDSADSLIEREVQWILETPFSEVPLPYLLIRHPATFLFRVMLAFFAGGYVAYCIAQCLGII